MTERRASPVLGPARGTVVTFDEQTGHGTVLLEDGREVFVHCVAIADGSRTVPVGASVRLRVRPGLRGGLEAWDVEPQ